MFKELENIEKDCLKLKKQGFLTEFGEGELHIIEILKREEKYSVKDLQIFPQKARSVVVGLIIANELHNISSILSRKMKKSI